MWQFIPMRVFVFKAFFITLVAAAPLMAARSFAAEVAVRTGQHAEYSRLVFDWKTPVTYTLEKQAGGLKLTFSSAATLNAADAKTPVPNIAGLDVLSETPLSLLIKAAEGAASRDLKVGNKVIIDIYNPSGGAQKFETFALKTPETKTETKPEVAANEAPSQIALAPKQPPQAELQAEIIQLKPGEKATTIAISSTQSFGMSAFENAGRLWIVNDKTDILLSPQVTGPNADTLKTFKETFADNAKIYHAPLPKGAVIKGQGGGVLWRIMLSADQKTKDPIEPIRNAVQPDQPRSGKLMWPLESAREVVKSVDPYTGETVYAVTVEDSGEFAGPARSFVDFDVLPSAIGLAIVPKTDNLEIKIVRGGVEIGAPSGLALLSQDKADAAAREKERLQKPVDASLAETSDRRIYDFGKWQLGGPKAIQENRNEVLSGLKDASDGAKIENLLTLAKAYLANGMGPEALGVIQFAQMELPSLVDSPEFLSLRGAADALSGHNEDAFRDLSHPKLKDISEIQIWRAYVLAALGDWEQAAKTKPQSLAALYDYPQRLRDPLALVLAEIALRNAEVPLGKTLLDLVEKDNKSLPAPQKAALRYLKGEAFRQKGNFEETKKYWEPLSKGKDDLYRVKAGLALTRLMMEQEKLPNGKAIDRLERLRYAWRGDELEAQVSFWLGKTYFDSGQHIKGLKIMRDAAGFVPNTGLSQRIADNMSATFVGLFLDQEKLSKVTPPDAAALYDQFSELLPADDTGRRVVEKLSEHLANADMFTRAADLLGGEVNRIDGGEEAVRLGTRLAAIRLLDKDAPGALAALNRAATKLEELPEELRTPARYKAISLLRARALSLEGRPDQSLAMLGQLENSAEINRLRADIAWEANYWDDAAEALGDVILDQNISLTRPLDAANADLILRRAVALNLASDRVALANMREKYTDAMSQTPKAKVFEVITRARQTAALADRETLMSVVSEIELFSDFLNNYKDAAQ